MAIARLLHLAGHAASIVLVGDVDRLSMDATQQLAIAENYGVPLTCYSPGALTGALPDAQTNDQPTTIVDAVFGIGLSRPVEGVQLAAIEEANALARTGCKILSVDIPSGICTDSGDVLGAAVNATATVTFAFNKRGLICGAGKKAAGELAVADIGIYDFDEGQAACTELPSEANEAIAGIAAGIAPIANHLNGIAAGVVSDYEPIVNAIVEGKITDRDEINHTLGWMLEYSYNEQMRNLLLTACRSLVTKYPEIVASHLQSYQQLYG
jgi:NAD(P)H-hydrate repair Nnr-like enzyme with NAD(P)H-hydrate epimerase domain